MVGETTDEVVLHARWPDSMEFVRARIWIQVDDPITFKAPISFNAEEVTIIEFEYEKLQKLCLKCKRMTHDQYHCKFSSLSSSTALQQQEHKGRMKEKGIAIKEPRKANQSMSHSNSNIGSDDLLSRRQGSAISKGKAVATDRDKGKAKVTTAWRLKQNLPELQGINVDKVGASRKHPHVKAVQSEAEKADHCLPATNMSPIQSPFQSPNPSPKPSNPSIPSNQSRHSGASVEGGGKLDSNRKEASRIPASQRLGEPTLRPEERRLSSGRVVEDQSQKKL